LRGARRRFETRRTRAGSRSWKSMLSMLALLVLLGSGSVSAALPVLPSPIIIPPVIIFRYTWPMFRHDVQRTGYTASPAPKAAALLWRFTTGGAIGSSPAVTGGVVYVGSFDNKTYALNASTGALIWEFRAGGLVGSSPAVAYGKVFVGANDNNLYALNQSTGTEIWRFSTGYLVAASPAVADNMVFIASLDGKVYALDELTGAKRWEFLTGAQVWSSPAVADNMVFVGSNDKKVYALRESTGAKVWEFLTGNVVGSSPAVAGGMVFIGSFDGKVYALDELTGAKRWEFLTGAQVWSSPALGYGKVFVGSYDRKVYALNQSTGSKIWEYTTGGYVFSSPAVADGMVFVGSQDRRLYALNQSTGERIWDYTTGDLVNTSPAVVDGKVYIGSSDKSVYAFGTHDIAVTSVAAPSFAAIGDTVSVNATVLNAGDFTETFQVDATYDGNRIGATQIVSNLAPGATKTLVFTWNTQGLSPGNYTVKALAWPVSGETDTADNEKGPVIVALGKAASILAISVSSTTVAAGERVVVGGSISPAREGLSLTIQFRPSGGADWGILATVTSDASGRYTYTWVPTGVGAYELRTTWAGDALTLPGESAVQTLTVGKATSTLTVTVSSDTVTVQADVNIGGSLSPPRVGVSVTIQYRSSGGSWTTLTTSVTDAAGSYAYTWTPTTAGSYELKAVWPGDASTEGDESDLAAVIVVKMTSILAISVSPTSVETGGNAVIEGAISPAKAGAGVVLQKRLAGESWSTLATVTADSTGGFRYTWTPTTQGSYELRATWEGDAATLPDESDVVALTVRAPAFPIDPLILAALAGGVVVLVAVAMMLRRRPKKPERPKPTQLRLSADPAEILADGKSTSQLTIELLDAEGKPLATETDRQVALSATEGRVAGSVTIPKGQALARTSLTSTLTVGTVSVSASSGELKGARVQVAFREKKRYCMHCGQRMPLEAKVCPSCGNAPPSGADTKLCRNCSSVIPIVARFCSECGASQPR